MGSRGASNWSRVCGIADLQRMTVRICCMLRVLLLGRCGASREDSDGPHRNNPRVLVQILCHL